MNMPSNGILLTAEQSARLALVDSVDRAQLIEHIVAQLRVRQAARDKASVTYRDLWNRGKIKRSRR